MTDRKLTLEHFEQGPARKDFTHLQNLAGLQEHGRARVDDAMKDTVAHITKKYALSAMHPTHIDEALRYINTQYAGRHDLTPKEKQVIEKSFRSRLGVTKSEEETI